MAAVGVVDAPSSCSKVESCTPTFWGDTFTSFALDDQGDEKYAEAVKELKDEALSLLTAKGNAITTHKLVLIDTLERLGVAYHFDQEIENQLRQIFDAQSHDDDDLFTTALRFRLLRQHGHHASSSVFDKFKGEDNRFNETLIKSDAKGLLSLYEAAQLRTHGEEILEEALAFAIHHLNCIVQQLESPLQDQVKRALHQSLDRGVSRIETRHYISLYGKDELRNDLLLKLAKLDFNYLQNTYKKELYQLLRWWNDLDLKSKLPYTRDRLVEGYFWGVALHFEPQYSYIRVAVANTIQMLTVMDDVYDHYAASEEANLFTQIVERWNANEIDRLPDDMKAFYKLILSIYDEYESEAAKQGKSFAVPCAKETVKRIARAYNKDHQPFTGRKMPTLEDYLADSVFTRCIYVIFTSMIPGVKSTSRETIDWVMSEPKILTALAKMGQHDLDQEAELPSGVDDYMKEEHGVSMQENLDKFADATEQVWKDLNAERIAETSASVANNKDIVELALNYARAAQLTCKSCQVTDLEKHLEPLIASLFVDPIIL